MGADHVLLPAAKMLQPYRQGDGSALCGLYSILNGIQLVLWPDAKLNRAQLSKLVRYGVACLDDVHNLKNIIGLGMAEDVWLELCDRLIAHSAEITGIPLRRKFILRNMRGMNWRKALRIIKRHVRAQRPVLVLLWGAYSHCTVIVGYKGARLLLFDSSEFQWVSTRSASLQHPTTNKRHRIAKGSVMALALVPVMK